MPKIRFDPAWGLMLPGAAASFLAFANPLVRLPFLILAVPLVLALMARTATDGRQALRRGWFFGWLCASASLYWIAIPVHDYGFLPWVLAVPCPMLMAAVLAIYPAAFCWLLRKTSPPLGALGSGLLAFLAWTGLEALKGWLFSGFPWLPLAASLACWPAAIQSVSLIGAYGLSGVLAGCGVWLAGPGLSPRLAALAVLAALAGYGLWAVDRPVATDGEMSAALVQGDIDQAQRWDASTLNLAIQTYIDLSRSVMSKKPDVVVWPETSLTYFVQEDSHQTGLVRDFVRSSGVPLVAGAPGYERTKTGADIFNRAYLITDKGLEAFYDKMHLVPFGEYAPFGKDIPILSSLMQGVGAFTPGLEDAPLRHGRLAMGMLICYECIFPELAQKRVSDGANVLVNISNDAWFGRSAAPRQHLELAVLRAVEQNRFLLRSTNTGVTALVDPRGRVLDQTELFTRAAVSVTGVGLVSETTVYHRLYGLLELACSLLALAALGFITFKKRNQDR